MGDDNMSMMDKPSKEEFNIYRNIQFEGTVNMLDMPSVIELSEGRLTKKKLLYIYRKYSELAEEYGEYGND